jgi:hypothetical protein
LSIGASAVSGSPARPRSRPRRRQTRSGRPAASCARRAPRGMRTRQRGR